MHKIFLRLLSSSVLLGLSACSSIAPLDPVIGNTGQDFSSVANSTDVLSYGLDLEIFPDSKSIAGKGSSQFLLTQATNQVELKLDSRFVISKILVDNLVASYQRTGGVITIDLPNVKAIGDKVDVMVFYSGQPHVALRAPWSGGFVWSKTKDDLPWIATAVQGEGCDLFWPCKDHFADKADNMKISLTVPNSVSAVTNGVLQSVEHIGKDKLRFNWQLSVPASDYNIAINVGPFERIQQSYTSISGATVPLEFWALKENTQKAINLIQNDLVHQIAFFENVLGPYPWGDQKLGFVETPHLGMEHQTINAYGREYARDENGFDWLLHHELAHEWFGNLITHEKLNDAWIHEGFAMYMQAAYSLEKFGEAAYNYSMYKTYLEVQNCHPIVRDEVIRSDQAFNKDIYGKGSWVLHTLRWLIGDEQFWQATRELLYGTSAPKKLTYPIAPRYRNTQDFVDIVNQLTGEDYTWLFDVYLKQAVLPELLENRTESALILTWKNQENTAFPMPIPVSVNGKTRIYTSLDGQITVPLQAGDKVMIDPQMKVLRYLPIIGLCEENQATREKR